MNGNIVVVEYDDPKDERKLQVFTEGVFAVTGLVTDFLLDNKGKNDEGETAIKSITIHPDATYEDFKAGTLAHQTD